MKRLHICRDLRVKKPLRNNNKTLQNCCSPTHLLAEAENKREGQRDRDLHLYPKRVLRPHLGKASIKSENNLVFFKVVVCTPVLKWAREIDTWREEKKQGWEWDGEDMEGEQKHLKNKQRDTHKNVLNNFSLLKNSKPNNKR